MEKTAIFLIIITLFLLAIILALLVILVLKMLKQNPASLSQVETVPPQNESPQKKYHPAILERMKDAEKFKPHRSEFFCPNHPDEPGETNCAICDKLYCKSCIRSYKNMHFCLQHLHLMMKHDWEEVLTVKTSTHDPERGVRLYEDKKEAFEKDNLPTYIETHYKINVDEDYIETYLVLFGVSEELDKIKERFKRYIQ